MTTKKDIENALMRGADTLRDTIDAANYKDYVLPIMFVKYLSDSYEDALDELKRSIPASVWSVRSDICPLSLRKSAPSSLSMTRDILTRLGS